MNYSNGSARSEMPRRRTAKKSAPATPAERRVLPMELQIGDRLADETGEWEVIGRPYTTAGGKNAHVRIQRIIPAAFARASETRRPPARRRESSGAGAGVRGLRRAARACALPR